MRTGLPARIAQRAVSRAQKKPALTFTRSTASHSSGSTSQIGRLGGPMTAALLMRTSIRPKDCRAASISRAAPTGSATFAATPRTRAPAARSSRSRESTASASRPLTTTAAPFAANARATARPIPRVEPVTTTTARERSSAGAGKGAGTVPAGLGRARRISLRESARARAITRLTRVRALGMGSGWLRALDNRQSGC